MENLSFAFPEKTEKEKIRIAKQFYKNLTDTFIEMIKLISIPYAAAAKRVDIDMTYLDTVVKNGKSVTILAGHQFNWEWASFVIPPKLSCPFVGIYAPIANANINKLFYTIRTRSGNTFISNKEFKFKIHEVFKKQYIIGLAADQNPSDPSRAYWLSFFGRTAPFLTGPGKSSIKENTTVVFGSFYKVKRGYYKVDIMPLEENPSERTPEEITIHYRNMLEQAVREDPPNYLWSHRRWRHQWKEGYNEILD